MSSDDVNTNVIDIRARLGASKLRAIVADRRELIEGIVAIEHTLEKLELAVRELGRDRLADPDLMRLVAQKIMEILEGFDPVLDAVEGTIKSSKLSP